MSGNSHGYLAMVLHAHLPFVRHPEHEQFLEEDWLYEAITETYLPLLRMFERLVEEGVRFRLTITLTPSLVSMLQDPLLQARYLRHIDKLIELAGKEVQRTRWLPGINDTARMYLDLFERSRYEFEEKYGCDLPSAFRAFEEEGVLEIITCGATHGFFPLMDCNKQAIRAQLAVACSFHESVFGSRPRGIWLPECGYYPGHDALLAEQGLRYFFLDAHGVLTAEPRPSFGVYAPVVTGAGVAAFGRDLESSRSVWSAREGYPGDYDYREFYRDIGFELDFDYIKPYIHPMGIRINTGIKYYRITGPTELKEPYVVEKARRKASLHARDFVENRYRQVKELAAWMPRPPLVVSPYDAELFGHWWFEGPWFLEDVLRLVHEEFAGRLELVTCSDYLERHPRCQRVEMGMSSWGERGYGQVWLNSTNDWIYRHLHRIADLMTDAAARWRDTNDRFERRLLDQMAREVLLAQSSDWAFIMNSGTMVEYAVRRTKDHVNRFLKLHEMLTRGIRDENTLSAIEARDNIFPDIDFRVYCSDSSTV